MTCEDARECFPLFLEGRIRLTELAEVEVHISQCAACRGELDRLQGDKPRARASSATLRSFTESCTTTSIVARAAAPVKQSAA
jgi:predicted anti-sigma-YlaC factor YlaD